MATTTTRFPLANPKCKVPNWAPPSALEAKNKHQFMEIVRKESPEEFCLRFRRVEKLAIDLFEWRFETSGAQPFHESASELPLEVSNWVEANLSPAINHVAPMKSLCIFGPTRYYKTVWTRSLGQHVFQAGDWMKESLRSASKAEYAIFKEIPLKNLPWKRFSSREPHLKIGQGSEKLTWGIPVVLIYSMDPRKDLKSVDLLEWDEKFVTVGIKRPIYDEGLSDNDL